MSAIRALLSSIKLLAPQYAEDVFSAYTYKGDSNGTRSIANGVDMSKGGMVWIKNRSITWDPVLFDSASGIDKCLSPSGTGQKNLSAALTSLNANGFTLNGNWAMNDSSYLYVSWSFKKSARFFDVLAYTGNGNSSRRAFPHGLGIVPGMIIYKSTSASGGWRIWHRSLASTYGLDFNATAAITGYFPVVAADENNIYLESTTSELNGNGVSYVAYVFAHDAAADGLIQCGSFSTDSSAQATVVLGFEPQFLMVKRTDSTADWRVVDSSRGMTTPGEAAGNALSISSTAGDVSNGHYHPFSSGFIDTGSISANSTFIYLAVRKQGRPAIAGSQILSIVNGDISSGVVNPFPADAYIYCGRGNSDPFGVKTWSARLIGNKVIRSDGQWAEANGGNSWDLQNTFKESYSGLTNCITYFLKRSPGFFDTVCYTGSGVLSAQILSHQLGVTPELLIIWCRNVAQSWSVYCSALGSTFNLDMSSNAAVISNSDLWNGGPPNTTNFNVKQAQVNTAGNSYMAWLFASMPGISKVGSYTGNGSSQTVNCGFSAGARFILIKRIDSAGDWYVWDSVRGIVSGNDPHISLNTTAAEVTTDDSIDPDPTGFTVNQLSATNINANTATYLYLAIA